MRKSLVRAAGVSVSALFLFGACGSGGSSGGSSGGGATGGVTVVARSLAFDKGTYNASAGKVEITLDNQDPVIHNITLDSDGRLVVEANAHQKANATLDLKAGSYAFHCSIPGHNMHGTFVVS